MVNQLFGYLPLRPGPLPEEIRLDSAQPVPVARGLSDREYPRLHIWAGSGCRLQRWTSGDGTWSVYVWGAPAHPQVAASDLPAWCAEAIAERRYERFRELLGCFVVILHEPERRRTTFVSDILGVRPMFLAERQDSIVFGSDVWPLYRAGLIPGTVDYGAVAAWIVYGYNCTAGSMFTELRRLPPAAVVVFEDGRRREVSYVEFSLRVGVPPPDQVADELHSIVSSAVKTLLRDHPHVSCALSGGFDSRYLAALAQSTVRNGSIRFATVGISPEEAEVADSVARALRVSLQVFPVKGSIWDLYDSVYHFLSDGFPISKFVTHYVAQRFSALPMLNGFLGDNLMRGSQDQFRGKYETEWTEDLVDVLQQKHLFVRFDLFREDVATRLRARSRVPMEEAVKRGSVIGKVFGWTDLYYRQRCYISNNFLEHLDITEAILPFYTWDLLSYKMRHDYRAFSRQVYERIFREYFPMLAEIPHANDLAPTVETPPPIARCERRWALQLLPRIAAGDWLSLLARKRCLLMSMAGVAGVRRVEESLGTFERLYLFERRVRDAGVDFDWGRLL